MPATVSIPAGSTSATFTLTASNNSLIDGTQAVTLTASASGFTGTSGTTNVLDNDVHHYAVSTIASPQVRGVPFSVTLTAKDLNDVTIASYTGTPGLSANGGGAVSITPTVTTAFAAGVWTGNVTVNSLNAKVVLTVSDGAGHTGTSNAFTVGVGALHHFAWSPVASPQSAYTPFSTTVTAKDVANNTVTGFTGTAALNGGLPARNVGTGTSSSSTLPLHTYYHDERTQCIYLQSEIGAAGPIRALALNVTTLPGQTLNNWTIRMKHTSLANYATAAWESTGWTTVYQANQTIGTTGLVTFTFPNPFIYNGTSNLMVDFSYNNSSYTSNGAVLCTTVSATRSIYYYTDSGYGDPLTWSGSSPTPSTTTVLPNLQILIDRTIPITPAITGAFVGGIWTGSLAVLQIATGITLRADDGSGHAGDSGAFNVQSMGALTLVVPPSASEGAAPLSATVNAPATVAADLTVNLASSDTTEATVPATVTIPAGQNSATFPVTIADDVLLDGPQTATITASSSATTNGQAAITVNDNETATLTVSAPATTTEGAGTLQGSVTLSAAPANAITVNLTSSDPTEVTVFPPRWSLPPARLRQPSRSPWSTTPRLTAPRTPPSPHMSRTGRTAAQTSRCRTMRTPTLF